MAKLTKQLDYKTIREIFTRFHASEPEPVGELDHVNVYTLVVAVALSAQATDKGVNKATAELFKIADTPQKMLDLGLDGVIDHIKTIGLFRNKAKNVIKLSQILVDAYLPPWQPQRHRARQRCRRRGTCDRRQHSRRFSASCASLDDPAWPLHLCGA